MGYIASFDGLRGIAVLAVLLLHATYGAVKGGWIGVDLFFVLSGFLITSLLQVEWANSKSISIPSFFWRRGLRLLPPLIVLVAMGNFFWDQINPIGAPDKVVATLAAVFYGANLIDTPIMGSFAHLWSLAVEEHFYLLWPFFVTAILFRQSRQRQAWMLTAIIIGCAIFRIFSEHAGVRFGVFVLDSYRFTLSRIDAILLGCLLAVLRFDKLPKQLSRAGTLVLIAALCITIATVAPDNQVWRNGGFVATNLLCTGVVFMAIQTPDGGALSHPALRWLGKRSYGLYVYHYSIFAALEVFREKGSTSNFVLLVVARVALAMIAAELSYRYIEAPLLSQKRRFFTGSAVSSATHGSNMRP
jgi:peptidoglycan/LPS O-acetylase OafA/YrhL